MLKEHYPCQELAAAAVVVHGTSPSSSPGAVVAVLDCLCAASCRVRPLYLIQLLARGPPHCDPRSPSSPGAVLVAVFVQRLLPRSSAVPLLARRPAPFSLQSLFASACRGCAWCLAQLIARRRPCCGPHLPPSAAAICGNSARLLPGALLVVVLVCLLLLRLSVVTHPACRQAPSLSWSSFAASCRGCSRCHTQIVARRQPCRGPHSPPRAAVIHGILPSSSPGAVLLAVLVRHLLLRSSTMPCPASCQAPPRCGLCLPPSVAVLRGTSVS